MNISYVVMDPASPYWQHKVATAAATLTHDYGVSGVYLDQVSSQYAQPCSGRMGRYYPDGIRELLQAATEAVQVSILSETLNVKYQSVFQAL